MSIETVAHISGSAFDAYLSPTKNSFAYTQELIFIALIETLSCFVNNSPLFSLLLKNHVIWPQKQYES
jgi:hypothetical protein